MYNDDGDEEEEEEDRGGPVVAAKVGRSIGSLPSGSTHIPLCCLSTWSWEPLEQRHGSGDEGRPLPRGPMRSQGGLPFAHQGDSSPQTILSYGNVRDLES